jgi:hypothetical protein
MPRRVLVPLDIPVRDLRVLEFAPGCARQNAASLFLLHVVDYQPFAAAATDSPLLRSPARWEKLTQR